MFLEFKRTLTFSFIDYTAVNGKKNVWNAFYLINIICIKRNTFLTSFAGKFSISYGFKTIIFRCNVLSLFKVLLIYFLDSLPRKYTFTYMVCRTIYTLLNLYHLRSQSLVYSYLAVITYKIFFSIVFFFYVVSTLFTIKYMVV